ncbi:MAG: alpha/beta hydrolase [SAR324 cluster bacterium]|nr:alpha/beta hydrolase [SAR324 cluster bacterium]
MKVTLADIEVEYTVHGEGYPVVFIHGLAEDHRSWKHVQSSLIGFKTYAYTLRGHGGSSAGKGKGSLEQLGQDLINFLETVTGPAQCVGYSLGGTIVLWAAAERKDLVLHAVVAGTSTIVGKQAADYFLNRIQAIRSDFQHFSKLLTDDTKSQIISPAVNPDEVAARRLEAIGDGIGYINAANAMRGMRETPLTDRLADIVCPVDIIGGDSDLFCPRKAAEIMMAQLPQSRYHEIQSAGHLLSLDQPKAYAEQIQNALEKIGK